MLELELGWVLVWVVQVLDPELGLVLAQDLDLVLVPGQVRPLHPDQVQAHPGLELVPKRVRMLDHVPVLEAGHLEQALKRVRMLGHMPGQGRGQELGQKQAQRLVPMQVPGQVQVTTTKENIDNLSST